MFGGVYKCVRTKLSKHGGRRRPNPSPVHSPLSLSLSLSLSPSVFGQLYQWFPCLLEEVLVDPPEELLLRELEVVPRRGVEEDLARLVGGAEAEGIRLVPRGIIDLVETSRESRVGYHGIEKRRVERERARHTERQRNREQKETEARDQ